MVIIQIHGRKTPFLLKSISVNNDEEIYSTIFFEDGDNMNEFAINFLTEYKEDVDYDLSTMISYINIYNKELNDHILRLKNKGIIKTYHG